jgi:alkylation response protein AidB-like acyl-CoA dehydrogenase
VTDWVAVTRSFLPQIEAARDQTEREGRVPHELIQALAAAGLFRLKMPVEYGGVGLDHPTTMRLVEELSFVDAATGWVVMIGNEFASLAGYLPADAAREIYGMDPSQIVAGANMARHAEIIPVPGGYRVSGQWALASGCPEAAWLAPAGLVIREGKPEQGLDGSPLVLIYMVPRDECTIVETWDALGLRGTASHDFTINDIFVPECRTLPFPNARSTLPGALWRGRLVTQLGGTAAVALGIARAAIDALTELADKVPQRSPSSLRERATVHSAVARAEALLRSARAFFYETLDDCWASQSLGEEPTAVQMQVRNLAGIHAAHASAEAVDLMYGVAGSSSVYSTSRLERCFRDVHVITQHRGASLFRYEEIGSFFLHNARLSV